jgi:hypothetical protein
VEPGEALMEAAQVVLERAVEAADGADARRAGHGLVECLLDRRLGLVGELEAVAAEELDPVVAIRVVRGGDDDAEVEPVAADQERRAGGREHAAQQRLTAGGGYARRDGGLEHLARLAGVADDEHPGGRAGRALDAGGGRAGERQGEIRGEELARDAADPVRTEQTAGQGAGASAWRTAAAYGPS